MPLSEQVAKALVGLLGRAEAREHAHRPRPTAVHRRLHAPREGELPGEAEIGAIVNRDVGRSHQVGDLDVTPRHEAFETRRHLALSVRDRTRSPRGEVLTERSSFAFESRGLAGPSGSTARGLRKRAWIALRRPAIDFWRLGRRRGRAARVVRGRWVYMGSSGPANLAPRGRGATVTPSWDAAPVPLTDPMWEIGDCETRIGHLERTLLRKSLTG